MQKLAVSLVILTLTTQVGMALALPTLISRPGELAASPSHAPVEFYSAPPSTHPFKLLPDNQHEEIRRFSNRISSELGMDWTLVQQLLEQAQWSQVSLNLTRPRTNNLAAPSLARNWTQYRARFLTHQRLLFSVDFALLHGEALTRAEQLYGVPASIIASILNIESKYGDNTGRYRSLDVLATLAFYHPTRRSFFQRELAELIRLWRAGVFDINTQRGSFAGAIGMAQFMPSSIRAYGVDFNADGKIDLDTAEDAIGSVAHYLLKHGWQSEASHRVFSALMQPINVDGIESHLPLQDWLEDGPKPSLRKNTLATALDQALTQSTLSATAMLERRQSWQKTLDQLVYPVALIDMPSPHGVDYRLGALNYYVITRYNRSYDYATAVIELAKAIDCAWQSQRESSVQETDFTTVFSSCLQLPH
jgi:membrane-bound lytic murein transglycosylase B